MEKLETIIVTGLSGAGKTKAIEWFEDNGYYCIDNMPPALIKDFISLSSMSKDKIQKAAFVVDVRGGEFFNDLKDCIINLKADESINCKILFIEASDATLIKRYNETRRVHPLAHGTASKGVVETERELLRDIRDVSDYIIDTTNMKPAGLMQEIGKIIIGETRDSTFTINVLSFGYKHGIPIETDIVFDMRFIPNPFYVNSLKHKTGMDKDVSDYVMKFPITIKFISNVEKILEDVIPGYKKEGKYHLNVAFGCTGGQHRSVAMAEKMFKVMKEKGYRVTLEHRDLAVRETGSDK